MLTIFEAIVRLFFRLRLVFYHHIDKRTCIDGGKDMLMETEKGKRKPVKLLRFDMLEPGKSYDISWFVKCYNERLFDKKPDEIMSMLTDEVPQFRGRFEVLDIDGGIDDIPIWYQVRLIKTVAKGRLLDIREDGEPIGWVNSLSIRKVKVREAV